MKTPIKKANELENSHNSDEARTTELQPGRANSSLQSDPRLVTRGESLLTPNPSAPSCSAITDWLNCTFLMPSYPDTLLEIFIEIRYLLGIENTRVLERGYGYLGWKRSFTFEGTNAIFAVGGQRGTALLSLPGQSCALISAEKWIELARYFDEELSARITRWDGAVDDHQGTHSIDWAVGQYAIGMFNSGGNKASCNQHGNWLEPDGKGRTFEVGRRLNGKLLRIYEKGKQLGDPNSPWVRWELEVHNKSRVIPWEVILKPGPFVAGAYKATSWISEEACRIKTFQKTGQIGYDALIKHLKNAYGPMINVMNAVEGSPEAVLAKIIGEGKPKRLDIPVPPEVLERQAKAKKKGA